MMTKPEHEAPLPNYYIAVDKGKKWHLLCKRCDEAWSVDKDKARNAGVMLHLLNHARSHD